MGGHGPKTFNVTPSRWQWHRFKDLFHFYIMLGVIPLGLVTLYCNVAIGPSQLVPIPDGYQPKEHELHPHPVSRFIAKYIMPSHQQDYEKYLQVIFEADEKLKMKLLENKVHELIQERQDSRAFDSPVLTQYHRNMKEYYEKARDTQSVS